MKCSGESIVVCNKNQLDLVQRIIQQKAIFARRCEIRRRRIKLIIEAICSGLCRDENDLENLLSLLFFEGKLTIKDELNFLIERKLICHQKGLRGTQLGRAVFTSSLSPDIALQVYDDLEKAMRSLALDTELHLLYLVTPLHNDSIWMNYIDWSVYYNIWSKLPINLQRVGKMIGIRDSFILGKIQGRRATEAGNMQVHLRFLSALALFDLIRECPLGDVARRFHINRGALQTLQQQSATYAYMVVTFCEKLGWIYLRSVLDGFSERLTFGVRKDLTELVQIEGIDGRRARAFHNANVTTVPALATTSIDDIAKILRSVVPYVRRDNNEGLNRWLAGEGLMTDVEAAQILIQRSRLYLHSSIRAFGIFSDTKINSLFSAVTSVCETNRDSLGVISDKCDNSMDPDSLLSDIELTSRDFFMHENFPVTNTSKNSKEQSITSTQSLTQPSEIIEKRPPKMKLPENDKLEEKIPDHPATNQENPVIPDRLDVDNVEQLCMNFANTSMSDETLLHFGCSQYSRKIDQITQALNAITVLAKNEKSGEIKSEKHQDEFSNLKIFESLDIFNSNSNTNEIQMIATTTATSTAILGMQNDNVENDDEKSSKLMKSLINQLNEPLLATECVMSQQTIFERIEEEKEIVVNSDESIGDRSIFDRSKDLFDRTFCSSISSQSFNTPQNSSYCLKRIGRRSSINQSPRSPSFQSPLHKMLKFGSSFTKSMEKEIKSNESIKNDTEHIDSNQTRITEFQIIDVCGSRTTWEQLLIRRKYWSQIGLGVAMCNKDIIGIALCALNEECIYIDFRPKGISEIEIDERLEALDNILKSKQQKYIYDLLSFSRSLRYLRGANCPVLLFNHCICVQTLSYLAHYRTVNDSALLFQDLLSHLISPERVVILRSATPRLRAAISAFICLHMHDDFMSAAIRLSSAKSVELELQSVVLFSEIEATGIPFDANEAEILNSKIKRKLTEIETKAFDIAGIPFNFSSAAEISQILFVRLQIPPPNISTARHYSTNKIVLQQLAPKHSIINLILEWRRMNTALTTSLPALLKSCCPDGRIRSNFVIHCCTGRVLTVHPNVQNVQKDAIIDGFSIRSLFIAPKGRILLSSDYRQLEMRMLAHLSADPQLISLFLAQGDFFEIITNRWNTNEMSHIKVDRNKIKQLCYGIIYGMGAMSLSKELGIQKQHAQQMIISFFQQFPKVRTWMDKIIAVCRIDGFVSTLLGRRRFLPQITGMIQAESAQAERQAINTCIQGSAAELFKMTLLNLQKNLLGTNSFIVMQMHDEVLIETDESSLVSTAKIIKHSMISVIPNLRVPLAVRISYGKSWGKLQEYVET
ncbi:DNA polymerase A family protein [Acanthocheilonema viteae]